MKCRECGKPLYKRADGSYEHERRSDPTITGGRRKVLEPTSQSAGPPGADVSRSPAPTTPPAAPPPEPETPPKREHGLHKVVFGGKKKDDVA